MSYIGDGIARAMAAALLVCIVATAAITAALIFGLPWLWSLIKPWLHQITG